MRKLGERKYVPKRLWRRDNHNYIAIWNYDNFNKRYNHYDNIPNYDYN
jgi:hypothetical protein